MGENHQACTHAVAIALLTLAANGEHAQAASTSSGQVYPAKPIRMIVAVPPGGPADTLARLVAPKLTETLGQTVVIDNRPGANGNIAYETAARAAPDGYTFVLAAAGVAINPSLYREVRFDPVKDFAAITQGISVPNILIVHPSVPAASVKELIALGCEPVGNTPLQFAMFVNSERDKWARVIKQAGIKLD